MRGRGDEKMGRRIFFEKPVGDHVRLQGESGGLDPGSGGTAGRRKLSFRGRIPYLKKQKWLDGSLPWQNDLGCEAGSPSSGRSGHHTQTPPAR